MFFIILYFYRLLPAEFAFSEEIGGIINAFSFTYSKNGFQRQAVEY